MGRSLARREYGDEEEFVLRLYWCILLLLTIYAGGGFTASAATARTQPAGSSPADVPSSRPVLRPGLFRVELTDSPPGRATHYWVRLPERYAPGQRPPLVVALHGTDDTAQQMLEFWSTLRTRVPVILVAPQGTGRGWSEADLPNIQAMREDLERRLDFDSRRVLLCGFSAGGAMTFHLLYKENFPATAAAALANYLPPPITHEDARARQRVPVFYGVGLHDLNHDRMRIGITLLRDAGVSVELYRPRIGHVLDPEVAQRTLDWFFDQTAQQLRAEVDAATRGPSPQDQLSLLEDILAQKAWHEPSTIGWATQTLQAVEKPGRMDLLKARQLHQENRGADAVELLRSIEKSYPDGRLARVIAQERARIEGDPQVRLELARRAAVQRTEQARALYVSASRLAAQRRSEEAAEQCREILSLYGDTPMAANAERLLKLLQSRSSP